MGNALKQPMRVLVLGETGVGKTTLIQSFLNSENAFISCRSTLFDDVYVCKYRGVKMEIIDVSGDGLDEPSTKQWMKASDSCVLVFSKNDGKTFEQLAAVKDEILKTNTRPEVPIFVVGNFAEVPKGIRTEDTEEVETVTKEWKKDYREVSAAQGWKVKELFVDLIEKTRKARR